MYTLNPIVFTDGAYALTLIGGIITILFFIWFFVDIFVCTAFPGLLSVRGLVVLSVLSLGAWLYYSNNFFKEVDCRRHYNTPWTATYLGHSLTPDTKQAITLVVLENGDLVQLEPSATKAPTSGKFTVYYNTLPKRGGWSREILPGEKVPSQELAMCNE